MYSPDLLRGERAVVTGGGSGIGFAISEAFLRCGAEVLITSRDPDRLAAAQRKLTEAASRYCAAMPCNVREEADVGRLRDYVLANYGRATIVVNNAAANFPSPADRMTRRAFDAVVATDLFGTFNITRALVPPMLEAGSGTILNVTLPHPDLGFPGYSHCGAAKAAIVSLTASWASEWGPRGVRVNGLAPGPVPTSGVGTNMLSAGPSSFDYLASEIPLRRLGTPEDIAAAAVFLCSPLASWITGQNLTVDGGSYLKVMRADRP
jgi:NAD(P)-dependent dehydrogenase (short-subunit alcohol dehydrogenase family)